MTVDTSTDTRAETASDVYDERTLLGIVASPHWDDEEDTHPLAWQQQALCAQTDPETFFPEQGGATNAAKKVCLACNVRGECLEYALANDERYGVWGGLGEYERRKMRKATAS